MFVDKTLVALTTYVWTLKRAVSSSAAFRFQQLATTKMRHNHVKRRALFGRLMTPLCLVLHPNVIIRSFAASCSRQIWPALEGKTSFQHGPGKPAGTLRKH